jgi:hypothetical protein
MPTFRDISGREWKLELDGLLIADLRDQHKIDLADLVGETWPRLERDPALLTVALSFLVADQFRPGESKRTLAQQLRGETFESAFEALKEAAKLFFPARHWSALTSAWDQQREAAATWEKLRPAMALLNRPDMPEAMRQSVLAAATDQMRAMAQQTPPGDSQISEASPSAIGLEAIPPKPPSDAPATAESTPAG